MIRLAPSWLLAAVPEGLVLVGPERAVELRLAATDERLERAAAALAGGLDGAELARLTGLDAREADALVRGLDGAGALAGGGPAPGGEADGAPLAEAVLAAVEDRRCPRRVWTADELLALPDGLAGRTLRRTLRAFIAGLEPHPRLRAYARLAARRRRTVWGDTPEPAAARAALERAEGLDPDAVHVVALRDGSVASVAAERLDRLGAHTAHRLGPVVSTRTVAIATGGPRLFLSSARGARANLRFPGSDGERSSGFGATPEHAELVARAEAVERYAAGDVAAHELRRARMDELELAVSPDALWRYGARQYAQRFGAERYDPAQRYLWVAGETFDGRVRWAPAGAVFVPFRDPDPAGALPRASSSGLAAHTDPASARRAALAELVERDAFMWTWVQRISRERIEPRGLDALSAAVIAAVETRGFTVTFVNLTLETWPVVLCAMHDDTSLSISAACDRDPRRAAAKSLLEACAPALSGVRRDGGGRPVDPQRVAAPADHRELYAQPAARDDARFLIAADEQVELDDLARPRAPLDQLVSAIGEPVLVELDSPATAPFHVVRALAPGLVPISFGYDREPLGMPRLAEPKTLPDGRTLGRALELERREPMTPHPFP